MEYPKKLVETVTKKMSEHNLEGFLSGQGPKNATLMLVGEAPGETEIKTSIPFSGKSGKKLDGWLADADLKRQDIYITSTVRSRPFSIKRQLNKRTGIVETKYPNRPPTKAEVLAYAPLLDFEIQTVHPKILVPMGNTGLKRLLGNNYTISDCHGKLLELPILEYSQKENKLIESTRVYKLFPIYHPAAVFYNRKLEVDIQKDWAYLASILKKV
ncbi:uracil-DNA glycosylase [Enterococcus quebecensis]|uniref:Uracil-DNA glycosylase n=1 Tax=Enterococcus quebecensis TaxID=903983 RepID=A0A1E5GWQ6_9ENTE|nr:uracil-DNA glycosylase [Enterococcus quebecensis]OEG17151.1 uracil-DNA glycosylase [Enterococcus quebecensis]OJG75540.1 uracil-DNA glycosylase, family 4 [Enterococcus quebecensis]